MTSAALTPSSFSSIDPKVNPLVASIQTVTDCKLAILEQILNTTLIEPEAQEKERLQDLSKDELIEQLLKAKVSQPVYSSVPRLMTTSDV